MKEDAVSAKLVSDHYDLLGWLIIYCTTCSGLLHEPVDEIDAAYNDAKLNEQQSHDG